MWFWIQYHAQKKEVLVKLKKICAFMIYSFLWVFFVAGFMGWGCYLCAFMVLFLTHEGEGTNFGYFKNERVLQDEILCILNFAICLLFCKFNTVSKIGDVAFQCSEMMLARLANQPCLL